MNDDFDAQLVSALRTLERDPADDGRAAVTRRVRRRRARGVAGAAAVALVVGIGIGAVIADNDNDSPRRVVVGQTVPSGPTAPSISAAATGVLTYPTTVAAGEEFAAVLRNPLSGPNTSCFIVVRLERWDGDAWGEPRELLPEGVDPNLAGPGADCQPDLIQPGAFIGERTFAVPADLPSGSYRIVERLTEGEGRITVVAAGTDLVTEPKPTSRHSIDLAPGGGLQESNAQLFSFGSAVVLDDDRLAVEWDSQCNSPGLRVDFDYGAERVTARLIIGAFTVIDCVGEPETWSTIVDLPAPLWGRGVDVVLGDESLHASRAEVTPISTFVLPPIEPGNTMPPIVSTSIFRQKVHTDSIRVQVYGGTCIADAQSAVYAGDDSTFYVQPHVQVANLYAVRCAPWQTFDIPVQAPPGSPLFGPASFW